MPFSALDDPDIAQLHKIRLIFIQGLGNSSSLKERIERRERKFSGNVIRQRMLRFVNPRKEDPVIEEQWEPYVEKWWAQADMSSFLAQSGRSSRQRLSAFAPPGLASATSRATWSPPASSCTYAQGSSDNNPASRHDGPGIEAVKFSSRPTANLLTGKDRTPSSNYGRSSRGCTKECIVCTDEKSLARFPHRASTEHCSHETNTCFDCLETHIRAAMSNGVFNEELIWCPECFKPLNLE